MTPRTFAPFLAVALLAHVLDLVTTIVGVLRGVPEDSPTMGLVLAHYGLVGMDTVKIVLIGLAVFILLRFRRRYRAILWGAFAVLTVPAVIVAVLNAWTIRGG